MKSRRPPLNLTEPKGIRRRTPRGELVSEDAIETADGAEDILEAPLDAAPEAPVAETSDFDIPETIARLTPPPEPTPPARPAAKKPDDEPVRRDLSTLKVQPEGVMKATGASPFIFWGATAFVSLLWACGLAAFVLGAEGSLSAFASVPVRLAILGFLALFPVGLIFASAFALRNAAALSRQTQRTAALADAMLAPAASAASQTTDLVDALRNQVDHAVRAVRLAHADIAELSARLKSETDRLQDAAQIARAATASITRSLEHERDAVNLMSQSLGAQSSGIIEAVDRQARMVADASDLAQTQLREAEASLASTASDMMGAASDVSDTARRISEDLDRQTQRLETAGSGVADQIRSVEEGLSQQRAGLVSAALSLRADQEDFAVHIENQRAQLTEALSITRVATVDLGETSARGIDVLRDIVLTAQENFRAVMGAAENERTAFETRIHATLSNISIMAADARDDLVSETRRALDQLTSSATEARKAADQAAQTAQSRVDRLNETIFEASKKADEVFDTRFNAARRLIENSAELIAEAGDQTAEKLDQSFSHAREAITEVAAALNELTNSADQLPIMARDRLDEIRRAVEDGISAMTAAAKRAAVETEAVDQAFQDRVKRNYDMLNEAVRLMGVISGEQPLPQNTVDTQVRDRDYGRNLPARRPAEPPVAPQPAPVLRQTPPTPVGQAAQRLRLSPISETRPSPGPQPQDTARTAPRPAPQPTAQPQGLPLSANKAGVDGWSWRDLLNGMDSTTESRAEASVQTYEPAPLAPQPPHDPEFDSLDDIMINEVASMGVDAAALLSRSRIEETISAIMAEDNEGARMVVRRVAPAAIRRLSRRLLTDANLRQQANDFATYYDQQINMALMTKEPSRALNDVLATEPGRAYLLLDAAISDLI
ncbi:tipN [Asticcacaulis biprosthecium C19]|uniref:TipN n=1 Tax=Asticcacaulis biprosthecium C19 TaxID=715226 RepID=F4QL53_9CAUL|nr:hypothetical protein [Asticcacaulis biprosthecium]EGF93428.1 tipN [Asticcacaulis biprosthecium C19]